MDILEMLIGQIGQGDVIETLSKSVSGDKKQIEAATSIALPTLVKAMTKNAESKKGLDSLLGALDQHSDSKVNNVSGFLNGVDLADGAKILGHLFGSKKEATEVQKQVAKKSGLDIAQAGTLLASLAPLLMGFLGNQKKEQKLDGGSILDMLGKTKNNGIMDMVTGILDSDKDGSVIDDIGNLLGGFFGKK